MLRKSKTTGVRSSSEAPPISVVIPFKNEAHNLQRLIDSLLGQDYRGEFEILLVNDNSTDDFEGVPFAVSRAGAASNYRHRFML